MLVGGFEGKPEDAALPEVAVFVTPTQPVSPRPSHSADIEHVAASSRSEADPLPSCPAAPFVRSHKRRGKLDRDSATHRLRARVHRCYGHTGSQKRSEIKIKIPANAATSLP